MRLMRPAEVPISDRDQLFCHLEKLSREEQEARLLELAASGDMLGAITMARRLYVCDLTQAKEFVDGLVNKRTPHAS